MALSANATIYADNVGGILAYVLQAKVIETFRSTAIMSPFVNLGQFAPNSQVAQWKRKPASLASAAVAQGATATAVSYNTLGPQVTMGKRKIVFEVSDEAMVAGGVDENELVNEAIKSLIEGVDIDLLALAAGIASSVGTTGTPLAPVSIPDAAYRIDEQKIAGQKVAMLSPKALFNIQNTVITSGASVWSNPNTDTLLGQMGANGDAYRGMLAGVPIYTSHNVHINAATDDWGLLFAADTCFGMAVASTVQAGIQVAAERGNAGILDGGKWIGVSMFFGVAELVDLAGVRLISAT